MRKILYLEDDRFMFQFVHQVLKKDFEIIEARNTEQLKEILEKVDISLLLSDLYVNGDSMLEFLSELKQNEKFELLPVVVLSSEDNVNCKIELFKSGIDEYLIKPFIPEELCAILNNNINKYNILIEDKNNSVKQIKKYKHRGNLYVYFNDFTKRIFDIVVSSILILVLSPVFLLIALAIRLESKGAVIYSAKRVGRYYEIFPFYKFRSMRVDADKMVKSLQNQNTYNKTQEEEVKENIDEDKHILYSDNGYTIDSKSYNKEKKKSSFFKLKNDPRVTKVGALIRKTSLDELPQLFNVLFGHMSIVGNRPLPVYEAEQMTSDKAIQRFSAPAGITGLWQVEKSKKAFMSIDERIELDTKYARKYNLFYDIGLMLKTLPAMIQKEE